MRRGTVIIIEMTLPDARLLNDLLLRLDGSTLAKRVMVKRVQAALAEKLPAQTPKHVPVPGLSRRP